MSDFVVCHVNEKQCNNTNHGEYGITRSSFFFRETFIGYLSSLQGQTTHSLHTQAASHSSSFDRNSDDGDNDTDDSADNSNDRGIFFDMAHPCARLTRCSQGFVGTRGYR
jgi:hypothetical protein